MSLRFCFVTTFYPPYHFGGDAMCIYRTAEALAHMGHSVDVIHSEDAYRIAHPADPEMAFEHHPNVTCHTLCTGSPLLSTLSVQQTGRPGVYSKQLRELLDEREHDVIHYANVSLMGGPGVLRLGRGLKLYTTHEYWLICPTHVLFRHGREACTTKTCFRCQLIAKRPPQFWRWSGHLRRCVEQVDMFLMPSRFAMDRHREDGLDRPMTLLPNFVPEAPAGGTDAPDIDGPYFLCVGRLETLKGIGDLIELFRDYREAKLVIVGDGDHGETLRRQAAGLDHVRFLGRVHPGGLGGLYKHAIALLMPSICYELAPLVPVEAFAQGTPAIVRNLGAMPEIVNGAGAGFTFDTLEQCREAMEALRTQPALRDELGRKGREAREREWTEEVHMERYLGIVDRMLSERRSS
ncbi:MAG: glycosyltransferase [Planctomycetota bacterium]